MAVNNITQTITTIPMAGRRGVDVQTIFVNKQEAFQDALTEVFVGQINTLRNQLNTFAGQVNTTATQINTDATTATTQAGIATTKASEASTSASQALTSRNQAETFAQQASASALSLDATNIVYRTGNQTIAGVKTFTSSPVVPVPTTDFQSVPLKSTNITVNVGTGQTYTTINQALEYLSGFYPMYKKSGITATINLKAGFVMAEQVLVSGIDLGWIRIIGEDAETIITHTALTTTFNGSNYPAFGVDKGGTSPAIGQLFRFNVEKVGGYKHGLMAFGAGSCAEVLSGKGFIGAGDSGVRAANGSTINASGANCSNAGNVGVSATNGSTINARDANCSNAESVGILAAEGSTINAQATNCSNAGNVGIYVDRGATINASGANCSNAVSAGIRAGEGSTIDARDSILQNQTTGTARVMVTRGATIVASTIITTGGTVPVFSQAINTLTGNGIIYG